MEFIVSSVLDTISTIISQEMEFLGGLREELQSIKDEFQQMQDFLQGADVLVQDHPDVKSWVAQVRDVAYDVEDVLDEFIMRFTYRHSTRWYGVFRKIYFKSVGAILARHKLATRIQEIKKRISSISETHGRYKTKYQSLLSEQASSSRFPRRNNMQYDKRADALLLEEADLVGIEVSKKELTDLLLNGDDKRTATSIVGMGGLGKTTLARNVYNDVSFKSHFECHVWITVSETFKLEVPFKDVIRQIFTVTDEEIAESYLNELVDRCLVQVADTDDAGNIVSIRVHDIIRQFILLKSSEQNLTTIFHGGEMMSLQNSVRRLAVQGSITGNLGQDQSCKSLRSLVLFSVVGGNISETLLSDLLSHGRKLVKVLDLNDAELERIPDEVFKLFHLKYLCLRNTDVKYVPKSIGMLQILETLDLRETGVTELPIEVQKLQHLRHLLVPFEGVRVSFKIGKLKSLQTLCNIKAGEVGNIRTVTEIGKLHNFEN